MPAVGFIALLRLREYRFLWLADVQSLLGDQLARVALSVLVYDRTRSALVTAVVYALSFLPALVGSVLLGPLADRLPRRSVLVGGDLIRAALLGLMTLPNMPVPVLGALLVLVVLVGTPWSAAESALVVDVLTAREYALGIGLRAATGQAAQVAGFAVGGIAVAALGARGALALDTATFLISAMIIRLGVHSRPAAAKSKKMRIPRVTTVARRHDGGSAEPPTASIARLVLAARTPRRPRGPCRPLRATLRRCSAHGRTAAGRRPGGRLTGHRAVLPLVVSFHADRAAGPVGRCCRVAVAGVRRHPRPPLTCLLWALSGASTAYQVQVVTEFVGTIDPSIRGQGISIAAAGLLAAQGVGLLAGGLITQVATPATAVATAGGAATVLGSALALARRRQHKQLLPPVG